MLRHYTYIRNDLAASTVAWEIVLVASVSTKPSRRQFTDSILLAVVGTWWHDFEEIGIREAVILLPLRLVELRKLISDVGWRNG